MMKVVIGSNTYEIDDKMATRCGYFAAALDMAAHCGSNRSVEYEPQNVNVLGYILWLLKSPLDQAAVRAYIFNAKTPTEQVNRAALIINELDYLSWTEARSRIIVMLYEYLASQPSIRLFCLNNRYESHTETYLDFRVINGIINWEDYLLLRKWIRHDILMNHVEKSIFEDRDKVSQMVKDAKDCSLSISVIYGRAYFTYYDKVYSDAYESKK